MYHVGHRPMETLFPGPTPHSYPNGPCSVVTHFQPDIRQQSSLALARGLAGIQCGYKTYPWKKNPADSLSRRLVSDALVRKDSVKDANAEYVQKLWISDSATDQEIQDALHQLFKSSPQGHSILLGQSPRGSKFSTNKDSSPQGTDSRPTVVAATAISKIQLDNVFKSSLYFFLQHEVPYTDILKELLEGTR